jgi:hypothetical protein
MILGGCEKKQLWLIRRYHPTLHVRRLQVQFPTVSLEFFIDIILPATLCLGVNLASNRNEYQEYFLGE